MPNWCFNEVEIKGTKKAIKKIAELMKKVEESGEFFEHVYPVPEGSETHWCSNNWGTKWDANVESLSFKVNENSISLSFDTAWSPPVEFFIKFSDIFKVTVDIRFLEEARDFAGCCICKNGKTITEVTTYNVTRDDILAYGLDPYMVMDEDEE